MLVPENQLVPLMISLLRYTALIYTNNYFMLGRELIMVSHPVSVSTIKYVLVLVLGLN